MQITRRTFATLAGGALGALSMPNLIRAQDMDVVKLAWTASVCVSGHALYALKNTNIAERNGIQLELTQFMPGSGISEALLAGACDIGSVSDFSGVSLLATGAPLKAVSFDCNFRTSVLATKSSGITSMADLKGKSIYGLFGITAYMNAQQAVAAAGLKPGDVNFVNIGLAELMDAVRAQKIEAFFLWDPWVALVENNGLAVSLSNNTTPAMVYYGNGKFLSEKPDVARRFVKAYAEAMYFVSQNHDLTTEWFRSAEPGKQIPAEAVASASNYDPRWSAKTPADLPLSIEGPSLSAMQQMADWSFQEKLLLRKVDVADGLYMDAAKAVESELKAGSLDLSSIKIKG